MITVNSTILPPVVNLDKLKVQASTAFGAHYIDCNQTANGAAWTVYLDVSVANQQTTWDNILQTHDGLPIPDPLVVAVTQAKTDEGATPINGLTVAQVDAWINANVTDLASAKVALRYAAKVMFEMRYELNLINQRLGL